MKYTSANEIKNIFARKLKETFPKQVDLEKLSGWTQSEVSKFASGKRKVPNEKIKEYAELTGTYPSDFFPPDWIRPAEFQNSERLLAVATQVFESYDIVKRQFGDFASPQAMAQVLTIIVTSPGMDVSETGIKAAMHALKGIESIAKNSQ